MSEIELDGMGFGIDGEFYQGMMNLSSEEVGHSKEFEPLSRYIKSHYPVEGRWNARSIEQRSGGFILCDVGSDGSAGAPDTNRGDDPSSNDHEPEWQGSWKLGLTNEGNKPEFKGEINARRGNTTVTGRVGVQSDGKVKGTIEIGGPFR